MQVSEVIHNPPLGKSDHDILSFDFNCYMEITKLQGRYLFEKDNYVTMREDLQTSSWNDDYDKGPPDKLLSKPDVTPEKLWAALRSQLYELTKKFVPFVNPSGKP